MPLTATRMAWLPIAAEGKFAEWNCLRIIEFNTRNVFKCYYSYISVNALRELWVNFESSRRYQPVKLPHANTLGQMLANRVHATLEK